MVEQAMLFKKIDGAKLLGKYKIELKFNGTILDVDCLSTSCKTVLNIMYYPDKVFCMKECGDSALEILYNLEAGSVYSDYALIPFDMKEVQVLDKTGVQMISDYNKLKMWWDNAE